MKERCDKPTLFAIATVSAAILAYEVLLMRLFAIIQWHHFAYMAISIALLGFGVSGTFLYFAQTRLIRRFHAAFAAFAGAFGITAVAGFAVAQRLPFNALEVMWAPRQFLYLLVMYVLLTVPFFAGATCVGLTFIRFAKSIGPIYTYNLVGSAAGSLGVIGLLYLFTPEETLRLIAGVGIFGAALAYLSTNHRRPVMAAGLILAAVVAPLVLPASWASLRLSPYKSLSRALLVPGAVIISESSSPLGRLTVVESPKVPFRHAPGLSLNNTVEPPSQLAIFTDGDGPTAITAFDGNLAPFAYLDFITSALPYHLLDRPSVLIVGAGGGAGVLQALYHRAVSIDVVELNGPMVGLVSETHRKFAGDLYGRPEVTVHVAEVRGFVMGRSGQWDLIQIPLFDTNATTTTGAQGMNESFVYTVEAFGEYLRKLRPGGYLAITRRLKLPPRDGLKLFATAIAALEREGVDQPARQLALIRGWNTVTLLVRKGAIGREETAAIRAFAAERSFDLAYIEDLTPEEVNRNNVLRRAYYHEAAMGLLSSDRRDFIRRYKFDIRPATDDRPYFSDFFRWRTLPELLNLWRQSGGGLMEWGYPILIMTLVQATILSVILILLPLGFRRRRFAPARDGWRVFGYFLCLGLGFLFIEIAFIQRFVLFLGHPIYAVALTLTGFLAFAGLGSAVAPGFARRFKRLTPIGVVVLGIAAIAISYIAVLPLVFSALAMLPDAAKAVAALVLIAPLAFLMGMPFPLGLAQVSDSLPELVPWAWGVNGCFSVISAVLAVILAIHIGFSGVVSAAAVFYLLAGVLFRIPLRRGQRLSATPS